MKKNLAVQLYFIVLVSLALQNTLLATELWPIGDEIFQNNIEIDPVHTKQTKLNFDNKSDIDFLNKTAFAYDHLMSRDVIIAVIDSGIDYKHPLLKEHMAYNEKECLSNNQIPYEKFEDLDQNGYKADCLGWNFTTDDIHQQNKPIDDLGHGTHIAGILASSLDANLKFHGLSNRFKILPLKVTGLKIKKGGLNFTQRLQKAIEYAILRKVDVINLSIGWPASVDTAALRDAIQKAQTQGIVFVAAAGNDHHDTPIFPCSHIGVICVGSHSIDGTSNLASNEGSQVDISAPGQNILSLYPKSYSNDHLKESQSLDVPGFEIMSGTSQAAPYVSAAVGFLKSIRPGINLDEIRARLYLSSRSNNRLNQANSVESKLINKNQLFGKLQIQASLDQKAQNIVVPELKGDHRIFYQKNNKTSEFDFDIHNLWLKSSKVLLDVYTNNKGITLIQNHFESFNLQPGQSSQIRIPITILNDLESSDILFHMNIRVFEKDKLVYEKEFLHHAFLSRKMDLHEDGLFHFEIENTAHLDLQNLDSIRRYLPNIKNEAYTWPEFVLGNKGRLDLVKKNLTNNSFEVQNLFQNPNIESWSWSIQLPQQNDITSHYLASAVEKPNESTEDSSKNESKKQILNIYEYIQKTNQKLVRKYQLFAEKVYLSSTELKGTQFLQMQVGTEALSLPVFMSKGRISNTDESPNPFEADIIDEAKHIYFYQPVYIDNKLVYRERTFDNYQFFENVRKKLNLGPQEKLKVLQILNSNQKDFDNSVFKFMACAGDYDLKRYFLFEVNSDELLKHEFKSRELDFKDMNLQFSPMSPIIDLQQQSLQDSNFFSSANFYSLYTGQANFYSKDLNKKTDILLMQTKYPDYLDELLASYQLDSGVLIFYQTKFNLVSQSKSFNSSSADSNSTGSNSTDSISEYPLVKSSMIPKVVFQESFVPTFFKDHNNSLRPALYADTSLIFAKNISLIYLNSENKLIKPMAMNIAIEDNCRALNPNYLGDPKTASFVLLCQEKNDKNSEKPIRYQLKFLKMQAF